MKTLIEKINAVADAEPMFTALAKAETAEEVRGILAAYGVDATVEEIEAMIQAGKDYAASQNNTELDLDQLENVAGGGPVGGAFLGIGFFVLGTIASGSVKKGFIAGAAAAAIGCYAPCP